MPSLIQPTDCAFPYWSPSCVCPLEHTTPLLRPCSMHALQCSKRAPILPAGQSVLQYLMVPLRFTVHNNDLIGSRSCGCLDWLSCTLRCQTQFKIHCRLYCEMFWAANKISSSRSVRLSEFDAFVAKCKVQRYG